MSNELAFNNGGNLLESVVIGGDLSGLSSNDRVVYYKQVCESLGLNPLTKPFEYMKLQGKLTLYARKDCTEQLRKINNISIEIVSRELVDDCYIVSAKASAGRRTDESIGAVSIQGLKGEARANAMMKAETKAKRRVTLSIAGLGMLDENEVETIPGVIVGEPVIEPPKLISSKPVGEEDLKTLLGYMAAHDTPQETITKWLEMTKAEKIRDLPETFVQKLIKRFMEKEEQLMHVEAEQRQWEEHE